MNPTVTQLVAEELNTNWEEKKEKNKFVIQV